jgi:hypothetical protein
MSKIEVNAIEPQSGTTLTLGASGDTVALAAGALQTGFGRTGTVDWSSTIRTSGFTAVSGVGYFCDTSSAAFTVTLPANPSVGDIVAIKDWSSTAATNLITIGRNGQKIEGNTTDGAINEHGEAQTVVFSGASKGWMVVNSGLLEGIQGPQFVAATGGTVLTCGNYKVHVFTGPGSFVVSCGGNDIGSNSVEYIVVAGGGSGGNRIGGGGGAGGFRQNYPSPTTAGLPVIAQTYPITVGAGGSGVADCTSIATRGPSGNPSIFSTITSAGGGAGGSGGAPNNPSLTPGTSGGSGGGASYVAASAGSGNTPPVSPPQGNAGGSSNPISYNTGGGGGGAAAVGSPGGTPPGLSGPGGIGSNITNPFFGPTAPSYGTPGPAPGVRYFAGGGGGGAQQGSSTVPNEGTPTVGGGGSGRSDASSYSGVVNTGGGGGGGGLNGLGSSGGGGLGGSGIVVIRYKYQ